MHAYAIRIPALASIFYPNKCEHELKKWRKKNHFYFTESFFSWNLFEKCDEINHCCCFCRRRRCRQHCRRRLCLRLSSAVEFCVIARVTTTRIKNVNRLTENLWKSLSSWVKPTIKFIFNSVGGSFFLFVFLTNRVSCVLEALSGKMNGVEQVGRSIVAIRLWPLNVNENFPSVLNDILQKPSACAHCHTWNGAR